MHRGLFGRIFVLYIVILLLAVVAVQIFTTNTVQENYLNLLKDNLLAQAALISNSVSLKKAIVLDSFCKQLKEQTGLRVTVVALDGKVLGDSDSDSTQMENHALRTEIQQAQLNDTGMTIRYSDTVRSDFLYVAKKIIVDNQPQGYIRVSMPLNNVRHIVNVFRIEIFSTVFVVILLSSIFPLWQIERIRKLTRQIRDFSRSLADGEVGKKLYLGRSGEFDQIAESLNTMSVELKKGIDQTEEEKNRLAVILGSIPDALLISDAKGVIMISNAASYKFFGNMTLEGKQFIEVIRNREFLSLLDDVRSDRISGVTECTLDYPAQRYCVVRVSPLMYRGENALSGFLAIFHDITQLKKLEQVRKDFVANISHEIKTPITAIQGFADTLLEGAMNDKDHAATFLQTIKANSQRINNLVDDLMVISKIELGVDKVDKTPINFDEVADAVLEVLRGKAEQKNILLKKTNSADVGTILADRNRVIQILTNLVDNAIKFTDTGSVSFGLAKGNERLFLYVEDTGIGIQDKHLSRLGERFYRVDPGRSRHMGGTGLGLAIVKHLVKAHGWDMRIESTAGKGTKVIIFIT